MRVELYERIWLWIGSAMIVFFLAIIVSSSAMHAVHPPSHVETIDPGTVLSDSEFSHPRIETHADGSVEVIGTAEMYVFKPGTIRVRRGKPVTFRLTSADVVHGFQIVGTNANATLLPGYISQFTLAFPNAGEFLIVCNEYCGLSHHLMQARLVVEEAP